MTILQENFQPKPLDQFHGYIWINGNLIPWQDSKVHVLTHSLHYSGGVFEGEKAYGGKVFKLEEHTRRLIESAKMLSLNVPYSFDEIIEAHYLVIEKNNIQDAYIRPFIWCGSESLNLTNESLSTNLMIAAIASIKRPAQSLNVHISRWRKAAPDMLPAQCKSAGHYNMMIVAKKEAKAVGLDDAILLDFRGYIAECTTSNIFFVRDRKIFTPIADTFLNGITRQTIIELARKLDIEVSEEYISVDMLEGFEGCFVTGTAIELQKVQSVECKDKKIIFNHHEIADLLKNEYDKLVRE